MAKGSVEDYHPQHPEDQEYFSDDDLEAIIRVAGGIPDGEVIHWRPAEDGSELVPVRLPRRVALKERLESAARCWDVTRQYENMPSPAQTAQAFKKVEGAANALLVALRLHRHDFGDGVLDNLPRALRDGLECEAQKDSSVVSVQEDLSNGTFTRDLDILQPNGADLLADAIQGIYRLREWSRVLGSRMSGAAPRTDRHEGDPALGELFREIALVWMDVFGGELRASVAAPGGANEGEAGGPTVNFFRASLKPLLGDRTPSDKAIRARIRRLRHSLLKSSPQK